ncbi:MAG: acetyl-CoA C-acetyltransferase [Acidobacteriota bacterium]
MPEAWIIDAARTPRGRGRKDKGALSGVHPQELLAQVLRALPARSGFDPADVEDLIVGCVSQVGEQGANVARNAVLSAGWPDAVTGVTLNRFCGSGLQASNFAALGVMAGQQDLVVAGGVESMSRVPMMSDGAGLDGGNHRLRERAFQVPQGISADLIATLEGFSRADVDSYALASQQRAAAAIEQGHFDRSLVPVTDADGAVVLARDEHPRPETTADSLAGLDPAFVRLGASPMAALLQEKDLDDARTVDEVALAGYPDAGGAIDHVHSAGSSSGIVDGAAAVVFAGADYAKQHSLTPRARVRAVATAGTEPVIMLTAPTPASQKALAKAGMTAGDIDLWEINEAFAAIPLQTMRNLGIEHDRVNVNGGAIALGHPLGATGAVLLGTLLDELERRDLATGLVTLCIGGGMGIATIVERV